MASSSGSSSLPKWLNLTAVPYQKMESLRVEADTSNAKVEELTAKVKTLEQDNLSKEQEITSLTHRNQLLEGEVEKLEEQVKGHKDAIQGGADHATQNESLQRRLQLLEDEAEEADKNLRETHEKYVTSIPPLHFKAAAYSHAYRPIHATEILRSLPP